MSRRIVTKYAPNVYYPDSYDITKKYTVIPIEHGSGIVNIGCFGAIRPMKNHLEQAVAAMGFANKLGKVVHFHINGTRYEQHGEQGYRNLVALFNGSPHKLVAHPWCNHEEFMQLVREMDFGMQISFSETFNIVAADMVTANIPIITSPEIFWMSSFYQVSPNDADDMVSGLWFANIGKSIRLHHLNKLGLDVYNYKAIKAWIELLKIK